MDAFAVAVCKGLATGKNLKAALVVGLYFGVFQMLMPIIGYYAGIQFADKITMFDHWIVFALLTIIGGRMIYESVGKKEEEASCRLGIKSMLPLALATSIDALAVGIGFAFLKVNIFLSAGTIGVTTFLLSGAGVFIGGIFGSKFKSKAEFFGGLILILIGLKILLEHLGVINF